MGALLKGIPPDTCQNEIPAPASERSFKKGHRGSDNRKDVFLRYLPSFLLLVCSLRPVTACSHPVCHCLSSSDRGAWIPPPAQRSELQSLAAAAGHRHPLRGHQTVSSTRALCQQFALGGISTSCLNTTLMNDAAESSPLVNIWYLALALLFFSISHAVAQHRLTFTDNGCL